MGGILGEPLGETPEEAKVRVDEATKTANDLSGLVRRKKAKTTDSEVSPTNGTTNVKRKAEDDADESDCAKKLKVEEGATGEKGGAVRNEIEEVKED